MTEHDEHIHHTSHGETSSKEEQELHSHHQHDLDNPAPENHAPDLTPQEHAEQAMETQPEHAQGTGHADKSAMLMDAAEHDPGYPLLGLLLMVLFTTGVAVVLGYAVLRSGSVLLAAYLHALVDQVLSFLSAIGFRPHNPVFSFYIGIYGILTLAIVAFFIQRDPIWKGKGSSLYQPDEVELAEEKAAA